MAPTAGFPTLADSLRARVDLIPEINNQAESPASVTPSISTESEDILESQDADEEANDNNEAEDPSQAASSTVENTDFSQALDSSIASPNTEDGNDTIHDIQDNHQDDPHVPDVPPPSEETLRQQAIAWMEATYADAPNGTVVTPPSWYAASHAGPPRPRVWIKDFFTGHVRPRRLVNDRLAEMSLMERERWANRQRRIRGEPAE